MVVLSFRNASKGQKQTKRPVLERRSIQVFASTSVGSGPTSSKNLPIFFTNTNNKLAIILTLSILIVIVIFASATAAVTFAVRTARKKVKPTKRISIARIHFQTKEIFAEAGKNEKTIENGAESIVMLKSCVLFAITHM